MNESKTISPPQEKKIVGNSILTENKRKELVILRGITTSQVNQALRAENPYPARVFLKIEGQEQDIPVFFRKKEGEKWIRPKIKTGSWIEVKGNFSLGTVYTKQSERKSFTAYSYQVLSSNQAKVETHAR